ncbi:MAG: hypothetical protein ABIN01_24795 [Ferruginibacter sp.]
MPAKQLTEKEDTKESFKEAMINDIALLLSDALPALKESLGEKKFVKRIRKAAKLLSEGIKPVASAKEDAPKKLPPSSKTITKKATPATPAKKAKKSIAKK